MPAVACLLEPSLASVLMQPEQAALLHAAKTYIIQECSAFVTPDPMPCCSGDTGDGEASKITTPGSAGTPALKRFRFLSSKLKAQEPAATATNNADSAMAQIARYMAEAVDSAEADDVCGIHFWSTRKTTYSTIVPLAEDLLAAPASQAFVERVFSLCGLLTCGRRNRMSKSLEMRAFLKLNKCIRH